MNALFARHALLPDGWRRDVLLRWDDTGRFTGVTADSAPPQGIEQASYVLPGMINLHSHSFQRALSGLTEIAGEGPDSFWTWRDLMYRFALGITPEQMEAIAAQLFVECLRYGYTSICEFHYVHRAPDGALYADVAETARRVIAAAGSAGIGITMLPVLYSYAGFGAVPLSDQQRRFRTGPDDVLAIVQALEPLRGPMVEVGVAPHSLRAASVDGVRAVVDALPKERPVHIHIAEQQAEVRQCLDQTGRRPVRFLFDNLAVDTRWCFVHATHMDESEINSIAASGAVAGLCPTTEANLGDGLFPLPPFLERGGRFGIGSDSHVSTSPVEELRWLEYGQRLATQRRNVAVAHTGDTGGRAERRVGDFLWRAALEGGGAAAGRQVGALRPGYNADLLVLDDAHPNVAPPPELLNGFIFSGNDNLVKDVLAGGRWVVRGREHVAQRAIAARFLQTLAELRELRS
ncbi:formimidoylglutamate deiminase [Pseudoduganella flava]|uniref:Formimidoylglutamate deiminase n=1 Tax=Pseudoduganella flava TaxID=871742 RepID=A0A562PW95_9BURK|nr:formimidoylglutamate deiminase [Pseudoduganella flava]QGZ39786.1 formimidoylglutamate deiminase [Pseudoduganella flava]TWI48704.1 formimidoylglutamate deiminase [Pseudoduganella flava]